MNNILQFRRAAIHRLRFVWIVFMLCAAQSIARAQQPKPEMIIRLSEITIHEKDLAAYKAILKEEAKASVRLEKGVLAIFPMFQKEQPAEVRILEIYQDQAAYQAHLKTPHFLKYKNTTLDMVKSLKLVDMDALDLPTATRMFKKMSAIEPD